MSDNIGFSVCPQYLESGTIGQLVWISVWVETLKSSSMIITCTYQLVKCVLARTSHF